MTMKIVTSDTLSIEVPSAHRRRGYPPAPDAPTRKPSRTGDGKLAGRGTFEEGLGLPVYNIKARLFVVNLPLQALPSVCKVGSGCLHPEYKRTFAQLAEGPEQKKRRAQILVYSSFFFLRPFFMFSAGMPSSRSQNARTPETTSHIPSASHSYSPLLYKVGLTIKRQDCRPALVVSIYDPSPPALV